MRVGLATGFLAAALSVLSASKETTSADSSGPSNTTQKILKEEDFARIQTLRREPPFGNRRLQETQWAEEVSPTVRKALISLYKAEREDVKNLKAGRISEKDRKVKICYTAYVRPGEEGEDMGTGPNLHVIKRYDEQQADGSTKTYLVNENWPTTESGDILPPEVIRIRVQAFKGSLYEPGADKLFVTDMFSLIWGRDDANPKPEGPSYPLPARQYFHGEFKEKEKSNSYNQTETLVTSPSSCVSCHVISENNRHTKHVFQNKEGKKINYGTITQDDDFQMPYDKQPGYVAYMTYLNQFVKEGKIKQERVNSIAKDLLDSTNMENPNLVEMLEQTTEIPWLEGDKEVSREISRYDPARVGFTYKEKNREWEKAIYGYYKDKGELPWIGELWLRPDLAVIPKSR